MPVSIGVLREAAEDETRVALTPAVVTALLRDGHTVTVENGAGNRAGFPDDEYAAAGATIVAREAKFGFQMVVGVGRPDGAAASRLEPGRAHVGMLDSWNNPEELVATDGDMSRSRVAFHRSPGGPSGFGAWP